MSSRITPFFRLPPTHTVASTAARRRGEITAAAVERCHLLSVECGVVEMYCCEPLRIAPAKDSNVPTRTTDHTLLQAVSYS